jgi:hypothetical protein
MSYKKRRQHRVSSMDRDEVVRKLDRLKSELDPAPGK